jgi:hypothetical protein
MQLLLLRCNTIWLHGNNQNYTQKKNVVVYLGGHDTQHNDIQHNDSQHKGLIYETQHTRQSAYMT